MVQCILCGVIPKRCIDGNIQQIIGQDLQDKNKIFSICLTIGGRLPAFSSYKEKCLQYFIKIVTSCF